MRPLKGRIHPPGIRDKFRPPTAATKGGSVGKRNQARCFGEAERAKESVASGVFFLSSLTEILKHRAAGNRNSSLSSLRPSTFDHRAGLSGPT